ncbi:hypothetical protein ACFFYR_09490 [Paraburkholderia dipogonis]|uniref:hypothetical protein n=1 Tax=Paraburkholderia dipogonis TaxID=1211383 RepID=UPI001AD83D4A|nr:hypothetical protein [Paraburkholderia dipogonis]
MHMVFTSEEIDRLTVKNVAGASIGVATAAAYDEQVRASGVQSALVGYPFFIETSAGAVHSGRVDARGLLPRVFTDDAASYTVYWGDEALAMKAERSA